MCQTFSVVIWFSNQIMKWQIMSLIWHELLTLSFIPSKWEVYCQNFWFILFYFVKSHSEPKENSNCCEQLLRFSFFIFFLFIGLIGPLKAATGLKFYFCFLNHWLDKKPSITKIITTIDPSHKPVKNNLNQRISVTTQKTDYDFQIKEI